MGTSSAERVVGLCGRKRKVRANWQPDWTRSEDIASPLAHAPELSGKVQRVAVSTQAGLPNVLGRAWPDHEHQIKDADSRLERLRYLRVGRVVRV